jgi:hypothetical protein
VGRRGCHLESGKARNGEGVFNSDTQDAQDGTD